MLIKNPCEYYSGAHIMDSCGPRVAAYVKRPLIIGGKRALQAGLGSLQAALEKAKVIPAGVETFTGYPSRRQMEGYASKVKSLGADGIIALGGGRCLDTSKAASVFAQVPIVTVPTVAATCAAWAALIIEYDDEGAYVGRILMDHSPQLVIADTSIMFTAEKRCLFSGVVDTFAKYYEVRPVFEGDPTQMHMDVAFHATCLAKQSLEEHTFKALREAQEGIFDHSAQAVVDSIVYLAGFAGAFQKQTGGYCFAHPFYHISARFPTTRHRMHGEKVAFGILTQLFLEGKTEDDIMTTIELFDRYENAFTLEDIGLSRDDRPTLEDLAGQIKRDFSHVTWSSD